MTTDFNGREPEITPNGGDAPLFAAQPVWERNRKRSAFRGRKATTSTAEPAPSVAAPEPRSFAREEPAMTLDDPMDRPMSDRTATVTNTTLAAAPPTEREPMVAPISQPVRTTRAKASSGASPAVIAGGLAALLVIGAGGWYLSRPHDGVPELAPGQPTTSEVAAAPMTPEASGVDVATNTLPPRTAQAPRASAPAPRQVAQQARVRPAARAPSAEASSSNASAVLPDGPQPYSTVNPAAPTQVTPPAPPPVQAAPPAAIPQTPPVQTPEPAPTPAAPAPTETPPSA